MGQAGPSLFRDDNARIECKLHNKEDLWRQSKPCVLDSQAGLADPVHEIVSILAAVKAQDLQNVLQGEKVKCELEENEENYIYRGGKRNLTGRGQV